MQPSLQKNKSSVESGGLCSDSSVAEETNNGQAVDGEVEMSDEELAANMLKVRTDGITRRKRLVKGPNLSQEDLKRLRKNPRHRLSNSSSQV